MRRKKVFAYYVVCLILLGLPFLGRSQAPASKLMVTWRASSYAPPFYQGKVLPTSGSKIEASAELFEGNKLVDLSAHTVYWYLNGEFLAGGMGVKKVELRAPNSSGNGTFDLRVQLPDYNGDVLLRTVEVPVVRPEAVIDAPFPSGFSKTPVQVAGYPFFFNVNKPGNLKFAWEVNGEAPTNAENPTLLNININSNAPNGYGLSLSLSISNPLEFLEAAQGAAALVYKK